MPANGLGERDDEAEEIFSGIGINEVADVIEGLDSFGRSLEFIRRGNCGNFLGLGNGSKNYGLRVVWREVNGWSTDGTVRGRWGDFGVRWWWCESGGAAAFGAVGCGCCGGGRWGWGFGGVIMLM